MLHSIIDGVNLVDYKKEAVVFYDQNFFKALITSPSSTPSLVSTEWEGMLYNIRRI